MRRLHADQSGQVSFLLVFFMLVFATLIFFVFNTGDQVNQSVMAQNAADAAAIAGANWIAHGCNVIAANNVAASKIIAMIAMCESIGPSVELALPNAQKILTRIDEYRNALPGARQGGDHPDAILTRALAGAVRAQDCTGLPPDLKCESLREECVNCITKLQSIQALLDRLNNEYQDRGGFPAALTRFDTGELWQILRTLQSFNDIIVQITPAIAQRRAADVGRGDWATVACILPIMPDFPVRAGVWHDYYDPVMSGLTPNWTSANAELYKAGYHTIFGNGWSAFWPPYERRDAITVGSVIGQDTEEEGENGNERHGPRNPRRRYIPASIMNWVDARIPDVDILRDAKGPFKVYRDDVVDGSWPEMRLSGFPIIFERVTYAMMQAIWNNRIETIPVPRWESDYVEITRPPSVNDPGGLLARGVNCAMTAWLGTRRNSHDQFKDTPDGTPTGQPWVIDPWPHPPKNEDIGRGWFDHAQDHLQGQWFWWGQLRVRTFDPARFGGLANQVPPDGYEPPGGNGIPRGAPYWLFYRWRKWLFLGAQFDTDTYSFRDLDRLIGDKSALFPYVLDPSKPKATSRAGQPFGMFDVMGFAYRPGRARVWSIPLQNPSPLTKVSDDNRPYPVNLACAQARVFNPNAWDLWTQDWHVKLVPAEQLLAAADSAERIPADLERLHEFDSALLTLDELQPVTRFCERVPRDASVLDDINNH